MVNNRDFFKHWPVMLLGSIVAIIFLIVIFSYKINPGEVGVVCTNGKITDTQQSGWHFRVPYFQKIYKFDQRLRCFKGSVGELTETLTKDEQNIIIGIYVDYKISDVSLFFKRLKNVKTGEQRLNSFMRSVKNGIVAEYTFDDLINTDAKKMKLSEIEEKMKLELNKNVNNYGLDIFSVGISNITVPETIKNAAYDRMIEERNVVAQSTLSKGKSEAESIRNIADNNKAIKIADAEAKAEIIRAEGDAKAAAYYTSFQKNPKLALFLEKLKALKKTINKDTTLILSTKDAPFNVLEMDIEDFAEDNNKKDNNKK